MNEMSIDLETYSDVDISKCGVYKYAESDHFEILLFGVSVDGALSGYMTLPVVNAFLKRSCLHFRMKP